MKAKYYGLFLALFIASVWTGCSDDDDDIRLSDVPEVVLDSFEAKYPNANRAEWEKKGNYIVADFWQNGMETHVWYNEKGNWLMTEFDLDINLTLLPQAVQTAFQSGQYASWNIEDINKYERPNEVFYLIEVEMNGHSERNLFYGEEGTLLKDEPDRENDDITPDTVL